MNPVLLQKQLKDNANDMQDFYKDLKQWGEEMRIKEAERNKPEPSAPAHQAKPKAKPAVKKATPKISELRHRTIDYSKWDKFDADAECEKVDYDENGESDLTDEYDQTNIERASDEKAKGNTFVKSQNWEKAIECYTRAIKYHNMDPVFYANRALCYLKLNRMNEAEVDCSMSLKLDNSYVKAYQRRAAAREALLNFKGAQVDFENVLRLEPNNKESRKALENLRSKMGTPSFKTEDIQRPLSKFAASRKDKGVLLSGIPVMEMQQTKTANDVPRTPIASSARPKNITTHPSNSDWPSPYSGEEVIQVKAINKHPHLRSQKPLKRLKIQDISGIEESVKITEPKPKPQLEPEAVKSKVIERKAPAPPSNFNGGDLVITETNATDTSTDIKSNINVQRLDQILPEFGLPKTSVQFYSSWRHLKTQQLKYEYLKLIDPKELPNIFKECLEPSLLSEMLQILAECYTKNNDEVYDVLVNLTEVKRFSPFAMFMAYKDKQYVWKLVDYIKESENRSKDEVDIIMEKFHL